MPAVYGLGDPGKYPGSCEERLAMWLLVPPLPRRCRRQWQRPRRPRPRSLDSLSAMACPLPPCAVLDILARVDDAMLQRLGAEPGGCVPVDAEEMARLLALPEVAAGMARVPGGSAANVMKGLAGLGQGNLKVAFVGMVGTDEVGAEYQASIAAKGVRPLLLEAGSGAPTATCLCLVTPDGQRTMRTALCAALELSTPQQLPPPLAPSPHSGGADANNLGNVSSSDAQAGSVGSPALLHCEGYSLYRPEVAAAAMRAARAAGARVSLDLASFEVVKNCWAQLDSLLQVRCGAADAPAAALALLVLLLTLLAALHYRISHRGL